MLSGGLYAIEIVYAETAISRKAPQIRAMEMMSSLLFWPMAFESLDKKTRHQSYGTAKHFRPHCGFSDSFQWWEYRTRSV